MTSTPSAAVAIIRTHEPMDSFLLLRRNQNPNDPWSGHFSFPGGRKDETDKDLFETCLRETYEETGIALQAESLQADMPLSIAGSRFNSPILVKPYLFQLETQPPLKLDHGEIQSSCWLETSHFLNTALHVEAEVLPNMHFPAFPLSDYYLWGFTYKLLINLLELQIAWKN
ncbi:CoA pyrophosphatase [Desulfopila sp. IMCC35008]|uniref:NUDIX hydrolase n=1 Tax=Desulfopila sp. IMCC35008 TaxID=2653858 RepID=UPI0013D63E7E|nr:CoA pyrophosphatase [Desulfopila sp. IMCC35008]